MVPTFVKPYQHGDTEGDLRIGWASWDRDRYQARSIKWAYRRDGKISRGSPEVPLDMLADLVILAHEQGELDADDVERIRAAFA
jgi:hypothetical protein